MRRRSAAGLLYRDDRSLRRRAPPTRDEHERRSRLPARAAAEPWRDRHSARHRAARRRPHRGPAPALSGRPAVAARARGLRAPAWLLKAGSVCTALLVFAGGMGYATSHLYSASAPLQPPVAAKASPSPTTSPRATAQTRGQTTARPQATLAPSVRTTTRT